ncbi:GxxExxY protein [Malonomonas rubra DSM 5091]|uniref:GxxExxY protein n=1 Tax=Malonomonas rubra DSM 5091 TaxID=1122189 RepID=A0A1M6GCI1_MALRU|nr:GxxExxY protein [Malonomonas rubra]SHJ07620.1 GxxExxY protein [Malonomonas rubra DSM 5091]
MGACEKDDEIGKVVVDAAFKVHRELGPGLLEKVYEACLEYELKSRGLRVARQVAVPIQYADINFDEGFRLDLLVENRVIVELKATEKANPLWQAQIISYLKLANKQLGFLINFNTPLFKQGIQRFSL